MSDIDRQAMEGAVDSVADAMHTLSLRITRLITETRTRLDDIDKLQHDLVQLRANMNTELQRVNTELQRNALPNREA